VTALQFTDVSANYGSRKVLRSVNARFLPGVVTGLIGPNGAGKTTLLRLAIRLLAPQTGSIAVLGRPLNQWSSAALARAMAYLPQNSEAQWPVLACNLVALGRLPHRTAFSPISAADERAVSDALARCDAESLSMRRMDELSAGERARVLLARALATAAPILLADEPAAYLDPSHQLRLMELLRAESARGTAVIVTLHDLALASRFCDEIVVLRNGEIAAWGAPAEALDDRTLQDVFAIEARRIEGGIVPWQRI
jgi:iron complex transport system ATP-binding protein